jgi:signal peptidase I
VNEVEKQSPPASRRARALAAAWWFGLAPLLATLATMRWLIPARSEVGPGWWGALAELGALYPLPLATGFFLSFAELARAWRDRLPFGALLAAPVSPPAPLALPQRITRLALVGAVLLGALALRTRVAQLYEVVGASMLPTFLPGDTLVVNKLARQPLRRGDIITFRTGAAQKQSAAAAVAGEPEDRLVKRVIGLPGDHVTMRAGIPSINGWEIPHCDAGTYVRYASNGTLVGRLLVEWIEDRPFLAVHVPGTRSFAGYHVQPGEVFVLGDDRSNSDDSRSWRDGRGAGVPVAAVEGRPWRVIGSDADGRVDLGRLLERPGMQLHLPGMDLRGLQAGVERCLKESRPTQTWPPPPANEAGPPAAG